MLSSILDNLKLIFSEDYDMSDSDYKKLSDILLQNNLNENPFDSGLIQIIKLFHKRGISFPVTMNLLQDVWSDEYTKFNFIKMLSPLIRDGIIKIKKLSPENLSKNKSIIRLPEEPESDIIVVVYSSDRLDLVISEFTKILNIVDSKREIRVSEATQVIPSKIKGFIDKLNRQLSTLDIIVSVESYMQDKDSTEDINLVISGVSNYNIGSKDIQTKFTRSIGRLSYIDSVEAYKDGKGELFLGISCSNQSKDYRDLITKIHDILNDLEVNNVS